MLNTLTFESRSKNFPSLWLSAMALATIAATLVKLYLALYTSGSADVVGFSDHLNKIREFGVGVYYLKGPFNNPFNSPPFMIHALRGVGWLADKTNLWFPFWLRL